MAGKVSIVSALENGEKKINAVIPIKGHGSIGEPNNPVHYVQIKHFTLQLLLVVTYHIFCEINVANKELTNLTYLQNWSVFN